MWAKAYVHALSQSQETREELIMGLTDTRATKSFYIEADFYGMATSLRAQFDGLFSEADGENSLTSLTYAYRQDCYQLLTASSERLFTPDLVEDLITRIRIWAKNEIGTSHVSTPHMRVFIKGCWRGICRDGTNTEWHYILWLVREYRQKLAQLKIVTEGLPLDGSGASIGIGHVINFPLRFNQLLVHRVNLPYGVETITTSMNPIHAAVFLDGYLW